MIKRLVPITLLAGATLALAALPAEAISFGTVDTTDTYAGVGIIRNPGFTGFTGGNGYVWCSGSLVSARVFLFAGHCVSILDQYGETPSTVWVSLQTNVFSQPYPASWLKVQSWQIDPQFQAVSGNYPDKNDLGVLVLQDPVKGVPFANLPPIGFLNGYDSDLQMVGYGVDQNDNLSGNRLEGTALVSEIQNTYIKLKPNPSTFCMFDSGGPSRVIGGSTGYVTSVHASTITFSKTGTAFCDSNVYDTRLDTASAQAFIQSEIAANP